jgi:hypothetical protein
MRDVFFLKTDIFFSDFDEIFKKKRKNHEISRVKNVGMKKIYV